MEMMVPTAGVPVTLAPYTLDVDKGRRHVVLGAGVTVAEIVDLMLPGLPAEARPRVRVNLVSARGSAVIPHGVWHLVRPHAGTNVVITIAPGDGGLSLLVSIAAKAISSFVGGALATNVGILSAAQWSALVGLGVTALGGLLINALFQPKKKKEDKSTYVINGWQNEYRLDEPLPMPLGEVRHAPPFAAMSYVEVVGDILYNRAIFCHGIGNMQLSGHRLGETAVEDYDEFQIEHRGVVGSPSSSVPFTLYTQQVIEDAVNADLVYEYDRDDAGELKPGKPYKTPKPLKRSTGGNASSAIVILSFPAGLGASNDRGNKAAQSVVIGWRIRKAGTDTWIDLGSVTYTNKKFAGFFRMMQINFPERSAWEIELTRESPSEIDNDHTTFFLTCTWALLQTIRPEYPINTSLPLALTAMRVKATAQMNGTIETYNCLVRRATDGFGVGWPDIPKNPATSALYALLGEGLYKPVAADTIDWPAFIDWRDFCTAKGLTFNFDVSGRQSLAETLKMIGAAGRGVVYFNGSKWTVIIDRPRSVPVDVITPRNATGISFETTFIERPDAIRVKFQDETNDFASGERVIVRPGFVGEPKITEAVEMPGVTNPTQVYRSAIRKFYELEYRSTIYRATQDGLTRSATRGDLVMASHDILKRTMSSARVKVVRDRLVEVDEVWTIGEGIDYAISFRHLVGDNVQGEHVVRRVTSLAGETRTVVLADEDPRAPEPGDIVMLGEYGSESIPLILAGIQSRQDQGSDLYLLPAAPIIDELTDAAIVPPWDGRVGQVTDMSDAAPSPPKFVGVALDVGTGETTIRLSPDPADVVPVGSYTIRYRHAGDTAWSEETCTAAAATVIVTGFGIGDTIEMQAQSTSLYGDVSGFGSTVSSTLTGIAHPAALPEGSISIVGKMGHAEITFAAGPDESTEEVRIYRDGIALPATVPVSPNGTFGRIDGDSTRATLVTNGGFDADANWTKGSGWTISGGKATKATGTASDLSQAVAMTAGKVYRGAATVSGRTAGAITPKLTGGATVSGSAISTNGQFLFRLTAGASPTTLVFSADSTFNGSIDDVVLYEETAACLTQGSHTYKFEPLNASDLAGPQSADFTRTVI